MSSVVRVLEKNDCNQPPPMRDDLRFEEWKQEVEIWQGSTAVKKSQQGGRLFNSLSGKPRDVARSEVPTHMVNTDHGVELILQALGNWYEKDKSENGYDAFLSFIQFKRQSSMPISDFVIEFKLKLNRLKTFKMFENMEDEIMAYYLLYCANLSTEHSQLCLTTAVPLTFDKMKKQIEKVASSSSTSDAFKPGETETSSIPSPQFVTSHVSQLEIDDPGVCSGYDYPSNGDYDVNGEPINNHAFYTRPYRGGGTGRSRPYSNNYRGHTTNQHMRPQHQAQKLNPPNEFGNPTFCRTCGSIYRWSASCTHRGARGSANTRPARGRGRGDFNGTNSAKQFFSSNTEPNDYIVSGANTAAAHANQFYTHGFAENVMPAPQQMGQPESFGEFEF